MQLLLEHIKIQPAQEKKRFNQFKKKKKNFFQRKIQPIQEKNSNSEVDSEGTIYSR